MIDNRPYPTGHQSVSSGLTEAELARLWAEFETERPLLYEQFLHPDSILKMPMRSRNRSRELRAFIERSFLDALPASEASAICLDMKIYFSCRKLGIEYGEDGCHAFLLGFVLN